MSDAPHTADLGTRYRYRQEGAETERERIIELLDTSYDFYHAISEAEFKLPDGNDVVEVNHAISAFNAYRARLLERIEVEQL